jgi:hypothetical protein
MGIQAQPQEKRRVRSPPEFLVHTLDALQTSGDRHSCDTVFNLDELDASEWECRKQKWQHPERHERPVNSRQSLGDDQSVNRAKRCFSHR